jgi:hypothetical protein
MHPIVALQGALVAALKGDAALVAITGAEGVFDARPHGWTGPCVVIDRHDVRQADGDGAPGQEHRVLLHCWSDRPSRRAALELAERVVTVALGLEGAELVVTRRVHLRTETVMDRDTGLAWAAVLLAFGSEPAE